VRPMRWTYESRLPGKSKLTMYGRPRTSRPRAATSVATRWVALPVRKSRSAAARSFRLRAPCSSAVRKPAAATSAATCRTVYTHQRSCMSGALFTIRHGFVDAVPPQGS
jgi:hypothetical protein